MRNKKFLVLFSILCALTCIVLLSSAVFSVQHVYETCLNGDSSIIIDGDMTLGQKVLASHGFVKGKSIFLADKQAAENNIEKNVPIVNVTSIVKEFPNRIYIRYEILFDYFQIQNDNSYVVLSDDCKVTSIQPNPLDAEKIVDVFLAGDIGDLTPGEFLTSTIGGEVRVLSQILQSFKRLGLEYYEITQLFDFIDLTGDYQFVFFKTSTGVYIRLMGWDNIDLKLQAALSVYAHDPIYRNDGTISVSDSLIATHSPDNLYVP